MNKNRPDFSEYVVHFTKDKPPIGVTRHADDDRLKKIGDLTAYDRLVAILKDKCVQESPMPWTDARAAAFTECPWGSLLDHSQRYSRYGVGFAKPRLYAAGGDPAVYLRPDIYKMQPTDSAIWPFVTPFAPSYARKPYLEKHWKGQPPVDYTHEREWRVPHDFKFEYGQVELVVVSSYEDLAKFPKYLKDAIGRHKFLIMDIYQQIERLWPTHIHAS